MTGHGYVTALGILMSGVDKMGWDRSSCICLGGYGFFFLFFLNCNMHQPDTMASEGSMNGICFGQSFNYFRGCVNSGFVFTLPLHSSDRDCAMASVVRGDTKLMSRSGRGGVGGVVGISTIAGVT